MTNAIVYTPDGRQFECETNDFTLKSLFLSTSESFSYGTVLKLDLGGVICHGEVVFVSAQAPVGLGLSLRVPDENIESLKAVMEGRPVESSTEQGSSSLPQPAASPVAHQPSAVPQPAGVQPPPRSQPRAPQQPMPGLSSPVPSPAQPPQGRPMHPAGLQRNMSPAPHPQAAMNRQPPRAPLPQRPAMNPAVPRGVNPTAPRGPSIPTGQGNRPMVRQSPPQNFVRPGQVPPNASVANPFRVPGPAPVRYPNQNLPGRSAPLPQPSSRPQAPVAAGLPNLDSLVAQMKATLASSPSAFSRFSLSTENTLEIHDHVEMAGLLFLLVSGRPVYVHT